VNSFTLLAILDFDLCFKETCQRQGELAKCIDRIE